MCGLKESESCLHAANKESDIEETMIKKQNNMKIIDYYRKPLHPHL